MNEQTQEFLNQINREIKRAEEQLREWRKEVIETAEKEFYLIAEFGIAKDAERLSKISTKLKTLYEQRELFKGIFGITE